MANNSEYNRKSFLIFAALFLILWTVSLFTACSKNTVNSENDNHYDYTAFNSSGTRVAEGVLWLNITDSTITGNWEIQAIGNPQNIGPQIGEGDLIGDYNRDSLWVELQPQMRDNNLMLIGKLEGSEYSGRWIYSSFIGVTAAGAFHAKK